jgi:hypothetical protein
MLAFDDVVLPLVGSRMNLLKFGEFVQFIVNLFSKSGLLDSIRCWVKN